jgi:amyloid beta precursor protein binding protein 1
LPHIASLVGGLVAQEITKLVTHQYVPTNGICIFDGYQSSMGILEF